MAKLSKRTSKSELIKYLDKAVRQARKSVRSKGAISLTFSTNKASINAMAKMVRWLKANPKSRKVTKEAISTYINLMEDITRKVEAETYLGEQYYEFTDEDWDFDVDLEMASESELYEMARKMIEEGYGSDVALGVPDLVGQVANDEESMRNALSSSYNQYLEEMKQQQQERREAFEKGFKDKSRF